MSPTTTDTQDDLEQPHESQRVVPDAGDSDGHFPGGEDAYVKEIVRKLQNIPTRQWTYIAVAHRARLPEARSKTERAGQLKDPRLTDLEFRVLLALVLRGNKDLSNSYPGLETLAKDNHVHPDVFRRVVRSLKTKKWINRTVPSPPPYDTLVNQFCVPAGVLAEWHAGWICPVVLSIKRRGSE